MTGSAELHWLPCDAPRLSMPAAAATAHSGVA